GSGTERRRGRAPQRAARRGGAPPPRPPTPPIPPVPPVPPLPPAASAGLNPPLQPSAMRRLLPARRRDRTLIDPRMSEKPAEIELRQRDEPIIVVATQVGAAPRTVAGLTAVVDHEAVPIAARQAAARHDRPSQ